jgi:hypothetical protein
MELTFRNAIIISLAIHLVILNPFRGPHLFRQRDKQKTLVVNYVILKEVKKILAEKRPVEVNISPETQRVEIKKEADVKMETQARPDKAKEAPPAPGARPEEGKGRTKEALKEAVKKETRIKSTKEYVSYYSLIREKIRRRLKENYTGYAKEGDVHLTFTLSSDGTLLTRGVETARSTDDKALVDIALQSLRESSPFARFPKALTVPRMSFSVLISFRKR